MNNNELQDMATFLGFSTVELSKEINGKKSVDVRCLPVRKLPEYAALIEDEPQLVALFTGLSDAEVDALPMADFVKILEKGHGLNFGPFSEWLKRKVEARKKKAIAFGADPAKFENPNGEGSTNA